MEITSKKIDQIFSLPEADRSQLLALLERVEAKKMDILIAANKVERYIYFIEKGVARAFCNTPEKQTTIWFGLEGDVMISFLSFFNNEPGYESIEMLEDSVLYKVSSDKLGSLYQANIKIANWGRKFAEQELLKTEQRFMDLQFKSATERYQLLINNSPNIIKKIQLGHIASYLGITQVSLSRIRAKST